MATAFIWGNISQQGAHSKTLPPPSPEERDQIMNAKQLSVGVFLSKSLGQILKQKHI